MLKSTHPKSNPNHLSVTTNNEQSYSSYDNNNFLSVNSIWVCRDNIIIAESQIGSKSNNKKEKKFVKVFIDQIISPSKQSPTNDKLSKSPSFSIYVKKRKYLFHILCDNNLIFLSLTTNTYHQQPLQEIFDLLYSVQSSYLYCDNLTFIDTLTDLHYSYQFKSKSKIILSNNKYANHLLSPNSDDTFGNYDLFNNINMSPTPTNQNENGILPPIGYNNSSYNSRNTKLSHDTLNLSNLPSPTPSKSNNSNDSCPFSDTPTNTMTNTMTYDGENDNKCIENVISNKSESTNNNTFVENKSYENDILSIGNESENEELEYFILKKGWIYKLNEKSIKKTYKYLYFELWSNGLLNYFNNEMKIKKKGSLNICDEVINVQLYSKNIKDSKQKIGEHGFLLTTHDKSYCFILQKENVRNDWYLLVQTITFNKKIDLNTKFKTLKLRLEKLEFKWERKFKNIEHDLMIGSNYEYNNNNIYQLQYDLNIAVNLCKKCKKEIVYFCGSDIFQFFQSKIDFISSNMEGTLQTINTIIHDRNETPFRKRKRNNNKWYTKRKNNIINQQIEPQPQTVNIINEEPLLSNKIKIRLPSKKLIRSKNALSKKIKLLNVLVYNEYFKIDVNRENTWPLIWRFDEMIRIKDIKGVYYGKKMIDKININDIKQFQITIFHQSNRRVQFIFNNEKEAYLWYTKLKSLYDKANVQHVPLYYGN